MAIPVLVMTPNAGFGTLICQVLDETGKYVSALAGDPNQALSKLKSQKPAIGILEAELQVDSLADLVAGMRKIVPDLLIVLIMPEGTPLEYAYSEVKPDAKLSKPVYLPELVEKVEAVIAGGNLQNLDRAKPGKKPARSASKALAQDDEELPPAPSWLQDVNLAAQHLTRLSLESSAQASLITRGDQIWAYAGELPRPAAEELARAVAAHFTNGGGSDLARFVRLEETGGDYMLYATGLGSEYVLATVFDAEMPFGKIRSQASTLAKALSTPPANQVDEIPESPDLEPEDEEDEPELKTLWPLLEDVPPPTPTEWVPESAIRARRQSLLDELLDRSESDEFSSKTVAVHRDEPHDEQTDAAIPVESPAVSVVPPPQDAVNSLAETMVSRSAASQTEEQAQAARPATRQFTIPGSIELEPVSPSMYNLTYACLLIPRFPEHHLVGEVATRLSDWISQLCLAFGWRLEHLSIRPEYVQWLVNVPPNTSPGYLMRTIRQHTSRRMFIEFPIIERDNPSGDFWAPGYLILGSPQPPPASMVQEFITNTRKRQGLF